MFYSVTFILLALSSASASAHLLPQGLSTNDIRFALQDRYLCTEFYSTAEASHIEDLCSQKERVQPSNASPRAVYYPEWGGAHARPTYALKPARNLNTRRVVLRALKDGRNYALPDGQVLDELPWADRVLVHSMVSEPILVTTDLEGRIHSVLLVPDYSKEVELPLNQVELKTREAVLRLKDTYLDLVRQKANCVRREDPRCVRLRANLQDVKNDEKIFVLYRGEKGQARLELITDQRVTSVHQGVGTNSDSEFIYKVIGFDCIKFDFATRGRVVNQIVSPRFCGIATTTRWSGWKGEKSCFEEAVDKDAPSCRKKVDPVLCEDIVVSRRLVPHSDGIFCNEYGQREGEEEHFIQGRLHPSACGVHATRRLLADDSGAFDCYDVDSETLGKKYRAPIPGYEDWTGCEWPGPMTYELSDRNCFQVDLETKKKYRKPVLPDHCGIRETVPVSDPLGAPDGCYRVDVKTGGNVYRAFSTAEDCDEFNKKTFESKPRIADRFCFLDRIKDGIVIGSVGAPHPEVCAPVKWQFETDEEGFAHCYWIDVETLGKKIHVPANHEVCSSQK